MPDNSEAFVILIGFPLSLCWFGSGILAAGKWMHWLIRVSKNPMSNNEIRVRYVLYSLLGPILLWIMLREERKVGQTFTWRWLNNFN